MIWPMSYGWRSSTTGRYAIGPLCTHTLGDTSICQLTFGIVPGFVIKNSEVRMIVMEYCITASEENSHPIYIQRNHKTSATFVCLVTRWSFTFHLLNTQSHANSGTFGTWYPITRLYVPVEHTQYCNSLAKEAVGLCRTQVLRFGMTQTGTAFNPYPANVDNMVSSYQC